MGCEIRRGKAEDGTPYVVTACSRGARATKPCAYCSRPHTKLCDFVVVRSLLPDDEPPTTCDQPLCNACAVSKGPDVDHCRAHALKGDQEA